VYKIPITAHILSEAQFENEGVKLLLNVREIADMNRSKVATLPPIN
jgi:hypothetical protein